MILFVTLEEMKHLGALLTETNTTYESTTPKYARRGCEELYRTRNQIILTKQSGRVTKILTASRILQISIALCQIKAEIHSFPTMYIIGGVNLV